MVIRLPSLDEIPPECRVARPADCILIPMDADRAGWALRTVMVVDDLRALTGPRSGSHRLPLHLDASARHLYDFSDVRWRELAYRTVLMEAGSTADLVDWIEREALLALWSQLYLPPFVRAAWERQHRELAQRGAGPHVPAPA